MLDELIAILDDVGASLLGWRARGQTGGRWEGTQFKAEADARAHEALSLRLHRLSPEIPVVSEENASSWAEPRPDRYWLIDPIDGTASFAQGYDGFVTQAALMEGSEPVLAVIRAPALDLTFAAQKGKGAHVNGVPLRRTKVHPPLVLIDNYPEPRGTARDMFRELGLRRYVECGSISLKICKVAQGEADLFFKDVPVRDWDLAAPHLVLREAGGVMTDIRGREFRYVGAYEREGLVAASCAEAVQKVVSWFAARRTTIP